MNKFGTIYIISNKINSMLYIGQTVQKIYDRYSTHKQEAKTSNKPLYVAMREFGIENFEITPFCSCFDLNGLNQTEEALIAEYNTVFPNGYNLNSGGFSHLHHEVTKKKISDSMQDYPQSAKDAISATHKGKSKSEVHKENISKSLAGHEVSETTRKKQGDKKRGVPQSAEHIAKRISKVKGKKRSAAATEKSAKAKNRPVIDQNGAIYGSLKEAATAIGTDPRNISAVVTGRRKSIKGYSFRLL